VQLRRELLAQAQQQGPPPAADRRMGPSAVDADRRVGRQGPSAVGADRQVGRQGPPAAADRQAGRA
jgi:hypothetical protein